MRGVNWQAAARGRPNKEGCPGAAAGAAEVDRASRPDGAWRPARNRARGPDASRSARGAAIKRRAPASFAPPERVHSPAPPGASSAGRARRSLPPGRDPGRGSVAKAQPSHRARSRERARRSTYDPAERGSLGWHQRPEDRESFQPVRSQIMVCSSSAILRPRGILESADTARRHRNRRRSNRPCWVAAGCRNPGNRRRTGTRWCASSPWRTGRSSDR